MKVMRKSLFLIGLTWLLNSQVDISADGLLHPEDMCMSGPCCKLIRADKFIAWTRHARFGYITLVSDPQSEQCNMTKICENHVLNIPEDVAKWLGCDATGPRVKGQTIDELIEGARPLQSYALMSPAKDENGDPMVMVEGDIMMKMKEYMDMQKDLDDEEKGRQKRKAIRRTPSRWPNRIIPYEISSEIPASGVNVIRQAIDNWNRNTYLRIRPAKSNENNRIRFVQRGGCSSFIGIIGGTQDVTLGRGCLFKRIVEHEIGHAVGFFHEQSRPDRDNFVRIVSSNIQPGLENNFARQPTSTVNNFEVPYDYLSVMHYGATAFGLNRATTVRTIDRAFQNRIGNAPGLSFNDFKLANLMYSCNSGCQSVRCPEEGFQAEDCNCRCPTGDQNNPIRVCAAIGGGTMASTTIRPTTQVMNVTCRDNNRNCRFWASQGFCQGIYENFMSTNCKQSCSVCEQQPNSCMDLSPNCEYWQSRGYCTMTFVRYLQTNCAKTCGVCTPRTNRNEGQASEDQNQGNNSSKPWRSVSILILSVLMTLGICY